MDGGLTVWHNRRDTLLRIVEGVPPPPAQPGARPAADAEAAPAPTDGPVSYCSVYIPVGISPGTLRRHNITVEYRLDRPHAFETDLGREDREQDEAAEKWMRVGL